MGKTLKSPNFESLKRSGLSLSALGAREELLFGVDASRIGKLWLVRDRPVGAGVL